MPERCRAPMPKPPKSSLARRLQALEARQLAADARTERLEVSMSALRGEYARHGVELGNLRAAVDRHADILVTLGHQVSVVERQQAKALEQLSELGRMMREVLRGLKGKAAARG